MTPKISVLVPIYNVERYLVQCLDSLAVQTMQDAEFICINDGSTDGSRDIIQRYLDSDSRFRLIDKENSGYGASMNRGLDEARGEYIAILESDDFMIPEGLNKLYSAVTKHNADVAKANFWLHWSADSSVNSRPKDHFFEVFPIDDCDKLIDPWEDPSIFYAKPSIWSAIYRLEFLRNNNIRFLETPGASFQDLGFTFKVWASTHKITFVYDAIVHYRQDNGNSSVNSMSKVDAVFNEYAEISAWLKKHSDQEKTFSRVKVKMMYDSFVWNYERVAADRKIELLMKARRAMLVEQAAGHLDIRLFEPWKLSGLALMMSSPAEFDKSQRAVRGAGGSLSQKVLRHLRSGGVKEVAQVAARKMRTRK